MLPPSRNLVLTTGQAPKLIVIFAALAALGLGAMWAGQGVWTDRLLLWVVLPPLAMLGVLAAAIAIRCPVCGMRWVWHAISKLHSNKWLPWLIDLEACPGCGIREHPAGRARSK